MSEYISVYNYTAIEIFMEKEYSGKNLDIAKQAITRRQINKNAHVLYHLDSNYRSWSRRRIHEGIEVLNLTNPPLAAIKYWRQGELQKINLIGREEDIRELEREMNGK